VPTDEILRFGGLFPTDSTFNLGGSILERGGGWRCRAGKESASDNTRTRGGGAGGPAPMGGFRAGGGGTDLPAEGGPALDGLGGGGGALPGVVGACLSDAPRLLRGGITGAGFVIIGGDVARGGVTLRCGTEGGRRDEAEGDGRDGMAGGGGREGDGGGLELRRGGGARRGGEGAFVGGAGTVRAGRLGARRLGGSVADEEGFGGGTALTYGAIADEDGVMGGTGRAVTGGEGFGSGIALDGGAGVGVGEGLGLAGGDGASGGVGEGMALAGGATGVGVSRLGIEGGFPKFGGFAKELLELQGTEMVVWLTKIVLPRRLELRHATSK
jgi:hypothetical protein